MKILIGLLALLGVTHGELSQGFRMRWYKNPDKDGFFINVPLNTENMGSNGWYEVSRPRNTAFFQNLLSMYCYNDKLTFCALYDDWGVRGFQIAVMKDSYSKYPLRLDELGYSSWDYGGHEYWYIEQFFINEESQRGWNASKLLQDDAVYMVLPESPDSLVKISADLQDLNTNVWNQQGCVPTMGTHYYHTPNCNNVIYPWIVRFHGNQLVGTVWRLYGDYEYDSYFDHTIPEIGKMVNRSLPTCFKNYGDKYGKTNLHLYFIQDVNKLTCN